MADFDWLISTEGRCRTSLARAWLNSAHVFYTPDPHWQISVQIWHQSSHVRPNSDQERPDTRNIWPARSQILPNSDQLPPTSAKSGNARADRPGYIQWSFQQLLRFSDVLGDFRRLFAILSPCVRFGIGARQPLTGSADMSAVRTARRVGGKTKGNGQRAGGTVRRRFPSPASSDLLPQRWLAQCSFRLRAFLAAPPASFRATLSLGTHRGGSTWGGGVFVERLDQGGSEARTRSPKTYEAGVGLSGLGFG